MIAIIKAWKRGRERQGRRRVGASARAQERYRIRGLYRVVVIVAKLHRQSRDMHFILGLMAQKVPSIVCALGRNVAPFTLHIYAALAEQKRRMISQRTIAGLRAARARGMALGNLALGRRMRLTPQRVILRSRP